MKSSLHSVLLARLPGLILIALGLALGYVYHWLRLRGGIVPLLSTPFYSMAAGGFFGALIYDLGDVLSHCPTPTLPED